MQNIKNWIKIKGFENYSASDQGNIRNDKTERILKPGTSNSGYYYVVLRKQKKVIYEKYSSNSGISIFTESKQ